MLTGFSASDLAMIARSGGGLQVDGSRYSASDLAMIARNLSGPNCSLVVHHADRFSASDLAMIARNGDGRVSFS